MWLLFKGASGDLPTPSPAQSTQGDGEEVGGPKPKEAGASEPRHPRTLLTALPGHTPARIARNVPPLDFPFPVPPSQLFRTKGQGPGEGSDVLISQSPWCWESYLVWGAGCAGGSSPLPRPCWCYQRSSQNDVFPRSLFSACSMHTAPAALHGPSRGRTLVASQSPRHQAPQCQGPLADVK